MSENGALIFLTKGLDYAVTTLEPGECIAVNFELMDSPELDPFVIYPQNFRKLRNLFFELESLREKRLRIGEYRFLSVLYEIMAELEDSARFRRIPLERGEKLRAASELIEERCCSSELRI